MRVFSALFLFAYLAASQRERIKFDFGWKFMLGDETNVTCDANAFPMNMNGIQCFGLSQASATSADSCRSECCADDSCQIWQWCPTESTGCSPAGSCWIGNMNDCQPSSPNWQSQGRNSTPPVGNCTTDYCKYDYDDGAWRSLDVPHDFVIEGTFSADAEESHGYLPKGIGWYRKHFTLPSNYQGQSLWIYFDGIYRDSDAYLNNIYIGSHMSGYTSFWYDISWVPGLNFGGGDNVLAVRANANGDEGWWYEGGGIYRHVWLEKANRVYIPPWQLYTPSNVTGVISTQPLAGSPGKSMYTSSATLTAQATIANDGIDSVTVKLMSQLFDIDAGTWISSTLVSSPATIAAGTNLTLTNVWNLPNITLWDIDSPKLYRVVATVLSSDGMTTYDQLNVTTGIRKHRFDANTGFYLNDRKVKVQGLCNHQDFAGTGTAVPDRINRFRVQKLQEMGANAWRMSHNPPNSELLDFTDQYGMLVWDENRNFDNTPQYRDDVARLVLRDRNHPSIFIWSLCNEGGCMEGANDQNALNVAQTLSGIMKANDPINTRKISAAWNADLTDLEQGWGPKVLDVQGINYNYGEIDPYHQMYPTIPLISSETASCTAARGIYFTNDTACHKDIYSADSCANEWWTADATRDFVEGGFAWTGFDYKGEPTPYAWPDVNSNFGILDIAGFPKDTFYYYQSWWSNDLVFHVFPHWNNLNAPVGTRASTCNSDDPAQYFLFTGSGTNPGLLQVQGTNNCVTGSCSNTSVGCAPLSFVACNSGDSNQLFVHNSDASFQNVNNKGCLDLWNSGVGPYVGVYTCDGGANQKWDIVSVSGGHSLIQSRATNPTGRCLTSASVVSVWIYTNAYAAELIVNSVSQGKQTISQYGKASWDVAYAPGVLTAVAYDSAGNTLTKETIETTGAAVNLVLEAEYPIDATIDADNQDVILIKVSTTDSEGRYVPDAMNNVSFSIVSGPGRIYGVGNGDPSSHEPDKGTSRSLFNGLARLIVQATDTPGSIVVQATSPGLKTAQLTITSK